MIEKIDSIKKGWKRYTTSAVFVSLATLAGTKGIDLGLYVESVEQVYMAGIAFYAAIMSALQAIDKKVNK